jgi:hypothetical protein
MTRRDRDWNRPIPQRQQNSSAPSQLLRQVAGEHIPDPPQLRPMPRRTATEVMSARTIRERHQRLMDEMARIPTMPFMMPSTSGPTRSILDYTSVYEAMLRDNVISTAPTFQGTISATTTDTNSLFNPRAGMIRGSMEGVTFRTPDPMEPVRPVSLHARTQGYNFMPMRREGVNDLIGTMQMVYEQEVQRASDRIGRQIQDNLNSRRDIRAGMESADPYHTTVDWAYNGNPSINRSVPEEYKEKEKTYTMDEIKEWLKSNLEVKTQVFESDGEVSVTTTLVLDGEEISSDTDSAIL